MRKFHHSAHLVKAAILVLPHAEDLLPRIGLKAHEQFIIPADNRLETAPHNLQRADSGEAALATAPLFFQQ